MWLSITSAAAIGGGIKESHGTLSRSNPAWVQILMIAAAAALGSILLGYEVVNRLS